MVAPVAKQPVIWCAGGCGKRMRYDLRRPDKLTATCRSCRPPLAPRPTRACAHCGDEFTPPATWPDQRCCSISCAQRRRRGVSPDAPKRCISPRKGRACEVCSARYDATYPEQRTCSRACGVSLRRTVTGTLGEPKAKPVHLPRPCPVCGEVFTPSRTNARTCPSPRCKDPKSHPTYPSVVMGTRTTRVCVDCGVDFTYSSGTRPRKYCEPCRQKRVDASFTRLKQDPRYRVQQERNHRERARRHGVTYVHIRSRVVYERDGWTCGICGMPIDPGCRYPDLMSPSIDHIVPMSRGGGHVLDNVQAAHFICNSIKRDRVDLPVDELLNEINNLGLEVA